MLLRGKCVVLQPQLEALGLKSPDAPSQVFPATLGDLPRDEQRVV